MSLLQGPLSTPGPFCVVTFSACAGYYFRGNDSFHTFMSHHILLLYPFWTFVSFPPSHLCVCHIPVPLSSFVHSVLQHSITHAKCDSMCMCAQWNCPHGAHCFRMHHFPKAHVLPERVPTVQIKVYPMLCVVSFCWIYWCWFAKCCGHIWPLLIFL